MRNASLEGYFDGRPNAYVVCRHPGWVVVGSPPARSWMGAWSGPPWEGSAELDADRALVYDARTRAADASQLLPRRYRYDPSYLENTKGNPDSDQESGNNRRLKGEGSDSLETSDYANSYKAPWSNPRCVEPWGSDSPWQDLFSKSGLERWTKMHEEVAVLRLSIQIDPEEYPPGSPKADKLALSIRSELVDLLVQVQASRLSVQLERSAELEQRTPPGMYVVIRIVPSGTLAPHSGSAGEDDDFAATDDTASDDANPYDPASFGQGTAQNSPRMVAVQIMDMFASPADSVLATTLSLAQRYPEDDPKPSMTLLKKCHDGSFQQICSATWVFMNGFIALCCVFAFSWLVVASGRCCMPDAPSSKNVSMDGSASSHESGSKEYGGSLKRPE